MWLYYMTSYGGLVPLSVNDLLRLAKCFTNSNESLNSILSLQAEWFNRMCINENLLDTASLLQNQHLQLQQQQQKQQQLHSSNEEEEDLNGWIEEYLTQNTN